MNLIRFILFAIFITPAFFIAILYAFIGSLFSKNKTLFLRKLERFWCRYIFLWPAGIKVIYRGEENLIRDRAVLIVGNHQSLLDILILLAYLPIDIRFIAKTELYGIPLLGWFLRTAGHIRVDRARVGSGFTSLKRAVEYLTNNISVVIFPEGTRSHDGTLGRFKGGAIFATIESGAPIQPVAISGSYNILPRGHIYFHPTTVKLTVGKPVYINKEDDEEQKLEEIRKTIAAML